MNDMTTVRLPMIRRRPQEHAAGQMNVSPDSIRRAHKVEPPRVLSPARVADKQIGRAVRAHREVLGISQGRLGRHLGLTFSQIQKYENGSNRIGAGQLYRIAEFLGVTPAYFFDAVNVETTAGADVGNINRLRAHVHRTYVDLMVPMDPTIRTAVLDLLHAIAHRHDLAGEHPI